MTCLQILKTTFSNVLHTPDSSVFNCVVLYVAPDDNISSTVTSRFLRRLPLDSRRDISIVSPWNSIILNFLAIKATLSTVSEGGESSNVTSSGAGGLADFDLSNTKATVLRKKSFNP